MTLPLISPLLEAMFEDKKRFFRKRVSCSRRPRPFRVKLRDWWSSFSRMNESANSLDSSSRRGSTRRFGASEKRSTLTQNSHRTVRTPLLRSAFIVFWCSSREEDNGVKYRSSFLTQEGGTREKVSSVAVQLGIKFPEQ